MKARDADRTSNLRMLQAALKNEQINTGHELSDEEALTIIRKAVEQRQDSIEQYTKGNRPDLAAKEAAEMVMLKEYLPPSSPTKSSRPASARSSPPPALSRRRTWAR